MSTGSTAPLLVPPGNPSSGVSPMLVSMLFPFRMAHTLAPLPKCATIMLILEVGLARYEDMLERTEVYERPWAPYLRRGIGGEVEDAARGYVYMCGGMVWWKSVSKRRTWRDSGRCSRQAIFLILSIRRE